MKKPRNASSGRKIAKKMARRASNSVLEHVKQV
jgi:hypothetical protein